MRNLHHAPVRIGFSAIAVIALSFFLSGCAADSNYRIEVGGTWHWQDSRLERKFDITDTQIKMYDSFSSDEPTFTYSIIEIYNDRFNGGETGDGEYGCAVISLTAGPAFYEDAVNQYTVFRWQNLETPEGGTTTADLSFAIFDPENDLTYFKNKDEAFAEVTAAKGYFTSYYTGCALQAAE